MFIWAHSFQPCQLQGAGPRGFGAGKEAVCGGGGELHISWQWQQRGKEGLGVPIQPNSIALSNKALLQSSCLF